MVRKFAAKNFAAFLKVMTNNLEKEVLEIVNSLIKDDQDLVRIYIVDVVITLAGIINPQKHQQLLFPLFNLLAEDQSWRVKYAVCEKAQEVKI